MVTRKIFTGLLAVVVALSLCGLFQRQIDAIRADNVEDEMLYLPSDKLLTHFTAGLSSVVADILWLKTIQYTVKEFHNPDRRFTWLDHMCTTVTRLDPYYKDAYSYGGMLLAGIGAEENAEALLKRGAVLNPDSEEIPLELAKLWLLNRYRAPYSDEMAMRYLRMVAERSEEHKEFYLRWIRGIQQQNNTAGENARALWEDILNTAEDDLIVEIAQNNLLQLTIETNVSTLEEIVGKYEERFGERPESLEALMAAGLLTSLPGDPDHGRYFIDANAAVRNSLLLEKEIVQLRTFLGNEMKRYKEEKGRYPNTLYEWAAWADTEIPAHPDPSREWAYDRETGSVGQRTS